MICNVFKKYRCLSMPQKSIIWFTACNILIKGLGFITAPIFTRLLSEEEYGILAIFTSYEQILLVLATWELYSGGYQKGLFKYEKESDIFSVSTVALTNLITIGSFCLIGIFIRPFIDITGFSKILVFLLLLYLLFYPAYQCWFIKKRTLYQYKSAVFVTVLYTVLGMIVPIVALFLVGRSAEVKYVSVLISHIIASLFFYIRMVDFRRLLGNWNEVKEHWTFLIKFQGPLLLHALSYYILNQADRIMIREMVGNRQTAFYSVAYNLASTVSVIQASLNQVLTPWRYQRLSERDYNAIRKTTNILLVIVGAGALIFILIMPDVMKLLFGGSYYEAVWCIPPVSAGVYFIFLYSIFVNVEAYFEKTKYIMYISIASGTINIILNYICIDLYGYIAAGYTTLFSYMFFALGHYFCMAKICKNEIPGIKLFSVKIILLVSSSVLLCTVFASFLYKYIVARYAILLFVLLGIIIFKERLIIFFKNFMGEKKDEVV